VVRVVREVRERLESSQTGAVDQTGCLALLF